MIEKFCERFKKLREEKKATQATLAKELSVSRMTIVNYENGKSVPETEFIIKASKYFDCTTDYLLGLTDVKAIDIEKKAIAESIGLTEKAVNRLIDLNESAKKGTFRGIPIEHPEIVGSISENKLKAISCLIENELKQGIFKLMSVYLFGNLEVKTEEKYTFSDGSSEKDSIRFYDSNTNVEYKFGLDILDGNFLIKIQERLIDLKKEVIKPKE